ncbi:MAG: type II toxin-antitoxin system Phd/YefM family antitoxin [Xanthomonadaceae bacterium]|nr:type II toxin-antitoxin system Phd/YefM family antitoxin [Xanthomonadaceae bacterium]MDE2084073.1 type II toxin-antitoxin system Phd/YefM family antitoxin [Xanthomonadaceae bacterium]
MSLANSIKPISYFKANAAEVLEKIAISGEPMIITQNGEAKAVVQDIVSYEKTQETLAMLKLLAMSEKDIAAGRTKPLREVIERLRAKHKARG